MARRTINRMEKRAEYEAFEATQRKKQEDDEEPDDEEEDAEEDEDEAVEAGDEDVSEDGEDEEEEAPPKKRKKPAKEPKPRSRSRTAKVPRLKVVWGVFNNSYQAVATYDYPKRKEAEEHAARLQAEKKQTFFVQPIKEPIEDKKE